MPDKIGEVQPDSESVYALTDLLAETTSYLARSNTAESVAKANVVGLSKRLSELSAFVERAAHSTTMLQAVVGMLDRVEFVASRLNSELHKLLELCLKVISTDEQNEPTGDLLIESGSTDAADPAVLSSVVLKAFIDLLCVGFDASFGLFLFRVSYLFYQSMVSPSSASSTTPTTASTKTSSTATLINKLKDDFFNVAYHLLDSIDFFPFTSADKNVKIMMAENSKRFF